MKRIFGSPILLLVAFLLGASGQSTPASAQARHYVCAPCKLPCDSLVFDAPGTCPRCGMPLVEQAAATAAAARDDSKKVAILVFDGVEIIDSMGPYEVFGAAGCDVYTVAATKDPVTSAMGLKVVPAYTFADAPQPDVLVVPGGGVKAASGDAATLQWVTDVTARDQVTMSVCNGAFILASAGLLDGLTATTTSGNIDRLRETYPKIKVVENQRYVDNGRIMTTAGLSAGIDGALHVVDRVFGHGTAQQVALSEEYDMNGRAGFARAALADRNVPNLHLDEIGKWDIVKTEGDTRRWEVVVRGTSSLSASQLLDHVGKALAAGKWSSVATGRTGGSSSSTSAWKFSGRDGKPWTGTVKVEPDAEKGGRYTARLTVARSG
jgi:putative intracellular protease/amidase